MTRWFAFLFLFLAAALSDVSGQETEPTEGAAVAPTQSWSGTNRWARQETYWRAALKADPSNSAAQTALGWSLYRQHRFTEANEAYLGALSTNNTNDDAWYRYGLSLTALHR